jgi:hypothetical protein
MLTIKKMLFLSISFALVSSGVRLHAQGGKLIQQYLEKTLSKDAAPNKGPAPDYSDTSFWAATPSRQNTSDRIPAFLKDEKIDKKADVFFIHPTTYLGIANETDILEPGANRLEIVDKLKNLS